MTAITEAVVTAHAEATARPAPPVIDQARAILASADATPQPSSPEAKAMVGYARSYLIGELAVHDRLKSGAMRWQHLDTDLMFYGGTDEDAQREAVAVQADRCRDAALAYRSRLMEYQRREQLIVAAPAAGGEN